MEVRGPMSFVHSKKFQLLQKPKWLRRTQWLLRRNRKNLRRKQRVERHGAGFKPFINPELLNEHTRTSVNISHDHRIVITLPDQLDFETNYEATVSHFSCLRMAAKSRRRVKSLRFDNISYISPSAALVLASEVDCWNQIIGGRLKAAVNTWHPDVERLLCEMGYFELLNLQHPSSIAPQKNTTFLPFTRGVVDHRNGGALAKTLRIQIESLVGIKIRKQALFEGLSEAITNVAHHAYPIDQVGFDLRQWWLTASYNRQDQNLCVAFYDQGAGIPETLPRATFFELIKDWSDTWRDSEKIQAAMEMGRSATRRTERGKGLQNLVEFARAHVQGRLSIYSLRGLYRISSSGAGSSNTIDVARRDHQNSIGGTLVEWSVTLETL